LANTDDEWYNQLQNLIDDVELRNRIGENARQTTEAEFSLSKQIDFIEQVFTETQSVVKNTKIETVKV
jgi:glycosyltransferase involved in cell wall biosynthesis